MGPVDRLYYEWVKKTFGNGPTPEWAVLKEMFAEHLVKTKTKKQIWRMLCGPATGPCTCNCICAAGIAWNTVLAEEGLS